MWNYNGTSKVVIGKGYGELEYDFFTIDSQEDISGLVGYYRTLLGRFDYILDGYKTIEDNKGLSPNVKLAMKEHNANLCLTLLEDEYLGNCLKVRRMAVNVERSENRYDTIFFNFFHFPVADVSTYFEKGRAYQKIGYYTAAVMCYTYAIKLDPNKAFTYMFRGSAYADMGDDDSAIKDYNQAIKLEPNDADIYAHRGFSYIQKGNHAAALDDISKAINLDPNSASAYTSRGSVYEAIGDFYRARADYTKAIELDPFDEIAQKRLEALDSKIDL